MLRIRHLKIHNFKNASACRYLSYYNSDNKNNEENYTNPANAITSSASNNLQLAKKVAKLQKIATSIENKIDWMLILTFPTWVWTIGISIYKLLY
jgi:hypothetical protein